mmetsp:Transcript_127265/g.407315  ORF Transcript_127265/g.407315 Transcript_127265/m.407315 type:complete len:203 (+) Transcript_127265:260-868(+)
MREARRALLQSLDDVPGLQQHVPRNGHGCRWHRRARRRRQHRTARPRQATRALQHEGGRCSSAGCEHRAHGLRGRRCKHGHRPARRKGACRTGHDDRLRRCKQLCRNQPHRSDFHRRHQDPMRGGLRRNDHSCWHCCRCRRHRGRLIQLQRCWDGPSCIRRARIRPGARGSNCCTRIQGCCRPRVGNTGLILLLIIVLLVLL